MAINGNLPDSNQNPTTAYFNNFFVPVAGVTPGMNDTVIAYFQGITGDVDSGKTLASAVIYTAVQQGVDPVDIVTQLKKLSDKNKLSSPQYSTRTDSGAQDESVFVPGPKGTIANCRVTLGNAIITSNNSVSTVSVGATIAGNGTDTSRKVTVLNVDVINKTLTLSSSGTANVTNTTLSYTNPDTWTTGDKQYAKPGPSTAYIGISELDAYLTMFLNLNRVGTSLLGLSNSPQTSKYITRAIRP